MMNEPDTRKIRLSDGRQLSYSDIGTGDNGTWIHCHGIPGSRYELSHLNHKLVAKGLRVIVPDRPGYGASTPCNEYDFARHTADILQLADHLGLTAFSISGFSGGGVFAMAAANHLNSRIKQMIIAGTPAVPLLESPYEYASELTARTWQSALSDRGALARDLEALTGSVDALAGALISAGGDQEEHYLSLEPVRRSFTQSLGAALEQGSQKAADALARDSFLMAHCWTFDPADIRIPVRIIHGSEDGLVYRKHQIALTGNFPNATPETITGGHYQVLAAIWG